MVMNNRASSYSTIDEKFKLWLKLIQDKIDFVSDGN